MASSEIGGTATVGNSACSLTSRELMTAIDGSNTTTGAVTMADTYVYGNVTISDVNTMGDIVNVTIWLYSDDGVQGTFLKNESYGFMYYNNSGTETWYELDATGWVSQETYIDNSSSASPSMVASTGEWTFKIKLAKTANNYGTDSWNYNASILDSDSNADIACDGFTDSYYDVAYYKEFTMASGTVTWTSLTAGDSNSTANTPASGNNYITVTAINHESNIRAQASYTHLNRTGGGGTTWTVDDLYMGQTSSAGTNDGIKLSTSYQTLWSAIPKASESLEKAQYCFISVPDPCIAGDYTFNEIMEIVTT